VGPAGVVRKLADRHTGAQVGWKSSLKSQGLQSIGRDASFSFLHSPLSHGARKCTENNRGWFLTTHTHTSKVVANEIVFLLSFLLAHKSDCMLWWMEKKVGEACFIFHDRGGRSMKSPFCPLLVPSHALFNSESRQIQLA
jgi:hypothetical protein